MSRVRASSDQWQRLETYRQRYPIEDRLGPLFSLEASMRRRRARSAALSRRLEDLEQQLSEVRTELRAVEDEIEGSRDTGALLIEEVLDQIRIDMNEAWSPAPVRGFRVWRIEDNNVMGSQIQWPTPTLVSRCLRGLSGEDLPHPVSRCGPPPCGIYAVKNLDMFGVDLARGLVDRTVVGVVAMTGKVIEHEAGYRAQTATVVAVVARNRGFRLMSDDPEVIEELFDDPLGTMTRAGSGWAGVSDDSRAFLESAQSKEEQWI